MSELDTKCPFHRMFKVKNLLEKEIHTSSPVGKSSLYKALKELNNKLTNVAKQGGTPHCDEPGCMFGFYRQIYTTISVDQ